MEEKEFYTTKELVQEAWFPIKSTMTVKKLVQQGILEAHDISTNPKFKRYRISRESVINFMVNSSKQAKNNEK